MIVTPSTTTPSDVAASFREQRAALLANESQRGGAFCRDYAALVDLNGGLQGTDYATTFTLSQPAVGIVDANEMFVSDVPSATLTW